MQHLIIPYLKLRPHLSISPEDQRRLEQCASHQERDRLYDEISQCHFLQAIADTLTQFHHQAAYVIRGAAHSYEFQQAVLQTQPNHLVLYRWFEVKQNCVEVAELSGTLQWPKILINVKRTGIEPDIDLPKTDPDYMKKHLLGRFVITYVVTHHDRAWARIYAGCDRLPVHQIHCLLSQLITNSKISFQSYQI